MNKIINKIMIVIFLLLVSNMFVLAISIEENFSTSTLDPAWTVTDTYPGHGYYSLTGNSLRYYLQAWSQYGQNTPTTPNEWGYVYYPPMMLSRSFSGTDWIFETKITYYMPPSNGRFLSTIIWIGDDGVRPNSSNEALSIDFTRYADIGVNTLYTSASTPSGSLANIALPLSTTMETYYVKIIRDGYQFTLQYSTDGVNYIQAFNITAPASIDGKVQKVVLSGSSWATPAGSYADWDYIHVEPIVLDADADGDGIADDVDNCLNVPNPDQADTNGNGIGNACECHTEHISHSAYNEYFIDYVYLSQNDLRLITWNRSNVLSTSGGAEVEAYIDYYNNRLVVRTYTSGSYYYNEYACGSYACGSYCCSWSWFGNCNGHCTSYCTSYCHYPVYTPGSYSADYQVCGIKIYFDADGDGFTSDVDCNDNNPNIYPDAPEICDNLDNDCDRTIDENLIKPADNIFGLCSANTQTCSAGSWIANNEYSSVADNNCDGLDQDCDGVNDNGYAPTQTNCGIGECAATGTLECINGLEISSCVAGTPIEEVCDNKDNDCDNAIDEELINPTTCGFGACSINTGTETCIAGTWFGNTCEPLAGANNEVCEGSIDENCDGAVDEGCVCTIGHTNSCGTDVGECQKGLQTCQQDGTWGAECVGEVQPALEICDDLDNNCDGSVDEGLTSTYYADVDGDGYGYLASTIKACSAPSGYVVDNTDCDDNSITIHPGADDSNCNGVDENCDGTADNYFVDYSTACGVGVCANTGMMTCVAGSLSNSCTPGTSGTETCNKLDDDCDGTTDEDLTKGTICGIGFCSGNTGTETCIAGTWTGDTCNPYTGATTELCDAVDNDCDGFVDNGLTQPTTCGVGECSATGELICSNGITHDTCTAGTPTTEICNGVDDDCDTLVDEELIKSADIVFGLCSANMQTCSAGTWSDDSSNYLPVAETCDGLDDNCDGTIDEGGVCRQISYYCDSDGDSYISSDVSGTCNSYNCVPSTCTIEQGDDCDDIITLTHPGATETCDGIDNDCSALTVDGLGESWYNTTTTCGLGICSGNVGVLTCQGAAQVNTCNPYAGAVPESCEDNTGYDLADNNCDGTTDLDCKSYCDIDGDGYTTHAICVFTGKLLGDCDDSSADINPGKVDIPCDTIDQDCSGTAFLGTDNDGDTFKIEGGLCGAIDCDDNNSVVYPEIVENQQCLGSSTLCPGTQQRICQIDGTYTSWTTCDFTSSNTQSCSDINACTTGDVCSEGSCVGSVVTCESRGRCDGINKVWTGTCDPYIGCTIEDAPIETCNSIDDDCDNIFDEDFTDLGTSCSVGIGACKETGKMVCNERGTKCDAVAGTPQLELCDAGLVDDNCDGTVNEGCTCIEGETKPCGQSNVGECRLGTQTCDINGNWGECAGAIYPAVEVCDGKDNDCNERTDESLADIMTDVYGKGNIGECRVQVEKCLEGTYTTVQQAVGPSIETCDSKDNNCNGLIDDLDADNDGFNDCNGQDKCTGLTLPQRPTAFIKLNPNSYALNSQIGYGCTCEEILAFCKPGETLGQYKYGCSQGTYKNWFNQRGWAVETECQINEKVT